MNKPQKSLALRYSTFTAQHYQQVIQDELHKQAPVIHVDHDTIDLPDLIRRAKAHR